MIIEITRQKVIYRLMFMLHIENGREIFRSRSRENMKKYIKEKRKTEDSSSGQEVERKRKIDI